MANIAPVPRDPGLRYGPQGESPQGLRLPDWFNKEGLNGRELDPTTLPTLEDYKSNKSYYFVPAAAGGIGLGMLGGLFTASRIAKLNTKLAVGIGAAAGLAAAEGCAYLIRNSDAQNEFERDFPKRLFDYKNVD